MKTIYLLLLVSLLSLRSFTSKAQNPSIQDDIQISESIELNVSDGISNLNHNLIRWYFNEVYSSPLTKLELIIVRDDQDPIVKNLNIDDKSYLDTEIKASSSIQYTLRVTLESKEKFISKTYDIYKYFTEIPLKPLNLRGEVIKKEDENYLLLTWEKSPKDKLTHHYQVFKSLIMNPEELAFISEFSNITETKLLMPLPKSNGKKFRYAVRAASDGTLLSEISDTIEIISPSTSLPFIQFETVNADKNIITLEWSYPNYILDLAGFRVYESGKLVADESILDAAKRKIVFENLEIGTYLYTIKAVSVSGVLSASSQSRIFKVEEKY